jgi:hypothetical protein
MADLAWPAVLPLPTFDAYAVEPLDAALRTEMEQGAARQRQVYTRVPERITVRWRFTQWQYAIFRSWYANRAKRGAAFFTMSLLSGLGMVEHEVRFVGRGATPWRATPMRGPRWIVTSTLEVRESPDLSDEVLDIALAVEDVAGLIAAIDALGLLVNTTLAADPW